MLRRVLILEENTDHLELLTSLLEDHFAPIDIHTVETIEDCLNFLEQTDYDLVMTGCFIHKTCITEKLPDIVDRSQDAPIIVVSGSGDENIAAQVIKLGASDYLVKTKKSIEKIPAMVEKYLKKSRRGKTPQKLPRQDTNVGDRLIRELDQLMQKARTLTTNIALKTLPEDSIALESIFSQIQHLRSLLTKHPSAGKKSPK